MGRKPRIDYDGACQHIIVKGIDSSYIFEKKFIQRLIAYKEKHGVKLFAYCSNGQSHPPIYPIR